MPPWSLPRRIAFRFAFSYVVAYMLPFPAGWLPGNLGRPVFAAKEALALFVGRHLLHATVVPDPMNGSGDRLINWAEALGLLLVAALVTLVWSLVDRHAPRYGRLHRLLRIYLRYFLGITMIGYGLSKIFITQMPVPPTPRLEQAVGDMSPMGLLWTFMGASPAYERFTGFAETIGGLLLLWRRTTSIGALVLLGVIVNVLALNLFYDVPVKLFLLHLLVMTLFLLLPDAGRLVDVLLLQRPTTPPPREVFDRRALIVKWCVKAALLSWIFYCMVANERANARELNDFAAKPAWTGDWRVEDVRVDERSTPPLLSDGTRWRQVSLLSYGEFAFAIVRRLDDEHPRYGIKVDDAKHTFTFVQRSGGEPPVTWQWQQSDHDHMTLDGQRDGHHVTLTLTRAPARHFILLERGFHWVNDVPFNR